MTHLKIKNGGRFFEFVEHAKEDLVRVLVVLIRVVLFGTRSEAFFVEELVLRTTRGHVVRVLKSVPRFEIVSEWLQ